MSPLRTPKPAGPDDACAERLLAAARTLAKACDALQFGPPVAHVYNPLDYAWPPYEQYVRRFGNGPRRVVFVGMNPGPFGMMQTGVPFGEIEAVRDWMGIEADVRPPRHMHPRRPIEGFACPRSEVSGKRLWGWAKDRFGPAERFFEECFVLNWCPLVFLEESGRNLTPDKLATAQANALAHACDAHLRSALDALRPQWAVGIGAFARRRLEHAVASGVDVHVVQVLHPSPASPAANRGWAQAVDATLREHGVLAG